VASESTIGGVGVCGSSTRNSSAWRGFSQERRKERKEGVGGFYSRPGLERKLGFSSRGEIERRRMQTCSGRTQVGGRGRSDGRGLGVSGRKRGRGTDSVLSPGGPWAKSGSGRFGFPAAFFLFFLFFFFVFFSVFLFIS
jgi:hypothetical protein